MNDFDEAYEAYLEWQGKHSDCTLIVCRVINGRVAKVADCPAALEVDCYKCGTGLAPQPQPIRRRVVRLGGVVNRADPTQSYLLECDHYAI